MTSVVRIVHKQYPICIFLNCWPAVFKSTVILKGGVGSTWFNPLASITKKELYSLCNFFNCAQFQQDVKEILASKMLVNLNNILAHNQVVKKSNCGVGRKGFKTLLYRNRGDKTSVECQ
jgi:hypothetical protein